MFLHEMEDRNFRSYYYEKVGFRVEEKKLLEIVFKEKPVDRVKLVQFALRFPVPAVHRPLLWKMLLDLVPLYLDQHEYVLKQRKMQFQDLLHALHVLVHLPSNTSSKFHLFVLMKHLESGTLKLDYTSQLCSRDSHVFVTINEALSDIIDSDCDIYWISKGIFELLKSFRPHFPALVSYTDKLLFKQDEQLHKYLVSQNILNPLLMQAEGWYENCFASVLPIVSLQRIWDKILGGSSTIMVFVVISLLSIIRQTIFKLCNIHKLVESMKKLTESKADTIVTEAIQMWHNCGSPILPGFNNDRFKDHHKNLQKSVLNSSRDFRKIR